MTFDLIGLPPTSEELDAFLRDDAPDAFAFAKVVDRLLASPRFGERWGRHWLDVARFAESSGKTSFTYPQAWRYRDWAIASFNADKPYEADPDNALVWRMSKRRLATEPPVGSAVARTGEGLGMFLRVFGQDASDPHRSVYLPVVRDQMLESFSLFDFADPSLVTGERAATTGPAQGLYFMNSPFVWRQAEAPA